MTTADFVPAVTAGPADLDALSQVIAVAFHDLPPSQWLVSDPAERARIFPGFFRILLDWAMADGDLANTRFSSLSQIDTSNVGTLKLAWSKSFDS